jgi:hypothetical protein
VIFAKRLKEKVMTDWADAAIRAMQHLTEYVTVWKQRAEAAEATVREQKVRLRQCIEARDRALSRVEALERELEAAVELTEKATAAVQHELDEIRKTTASVLRVARVQKA